MTDPGLIAPGSKSMRLHGFGELRERRQPSHSNVPVRFLLFYGSVAGQAVTKGWRTGVLLRSDSTLSGLARVLERPKFDRYLTRYKRAIFLQRFIQDTVPANAPTAILASHDARDDKFLELAVGG